jgi:hypothetical protein
MKWCFMVVPWPAGRLRPKRGCSDLVGGQAEQGAPQQAALRLAQPQVQQRAAPGLRRLGPPAGDILLPLQQPAGTLATCSSRS